MRFFRDYPHIIIRATLFSLIIQPIMKVNSYFTAFFMKKSEYFPILNETNIETKRVLVPLHLRVCFVTYLMQQLHYNIQLAFPRQSNVASVREKG